METAARWVKDCLLEVWTATSKLDSNAQALKTELLYAQVMLNNARDGDLPNNPELEQLLLQLRNLRYNGDDVLDELEYFRIQDQLDGTNDATDVGGTVLNARHTAKAVKKQLDHYDDQSASSPLSAHAVGEGHLTTMMVTSGRPLITDAWLVSIIQALAIPPNLSVNASLASLLWNWCSKAQQREHVVPAPNSGERLPSASLPTNSTGDQTQHIVPAPKLKFDRVEISQRMKDIVEQLKPLCDKVKNILKIETSRINCTVVHNITANRPETRPEIFEFKLYGRDNLKKSLVHDITHGKYCTNSLTVVPIVGPGGIGKTTFTQHIYEEVKTHFQVSVWICVSQDSSASRLAQEIVKKIPKSDNEKSNASEEESIQNKLRSRKVLLVLDDMWTCSEDEWKKLLALFKKVETTGNVIIVTTRIPKVAKMVATVDCFITRLERLDDKDCMTFFEACIFGDKQPWENHENLHNLGHQIVEKLKGFPLAVKTVGRLLRNKLDFYHWRRVLESREWEFHNGDDDIMPALKLSYKYLSFDLQQCFSHCALFPEDYEFGREELIRFWIGLGVLDDNQNKRMEDVGSDYMEDLIDHGFLEKSKNNEHPHPNYVIHDLLHDLAKIVSANECLSIHDSNVRSIKVPTSIRHLSMSIDNTHLNDRMSFEKCKTDLSTLGEKLKVENLRTLMLFGEYHGNFSKTFSDLFRKAKSLRVVLLSGASYDVEDLLPNFSQLIHLRYLRIIKIQGIKISLPSSISKCYHLMVLDIEECYCDSSFLGREMRNLVKLRHIVAPDDYGISSSISEVGKLKYLQRLNCFEVKRETNGFELKQLGQLRELKGSLRIEDLERVEDVKEAKEAKLVHMNHLHGLRLHWVPRQSIEDAKQEEDILESLKPHSYLREISIEGHRGTSCPSWLGEDLSVNNLEFLYLEDVAWTKFPPLGELCTTNEHGEECISCISGPRFLNLKRIELSNLPRLKRWRGNDSYQLFSCLEVLTVSGCSELLELPFSHCTCSQAEQKFPRLQEIDISDCPKLLTLPPIPWAVDLSIAKISRVGTIIKDLDYSKQEACLIITSQNVDPGSELWNNLSFHNLSQIEELYIYECPPMPLRHMQMLASVNILHISNCGNVLCPTEGDSSARCQIPVESLHITRCNASGKELTRLMCYFPKLRILYIKECSMITKLGVAAKHASLPSTSAYKTEDAHEGQQRQQTRGEETEAADGGLLLVPRELEILEIETCPNLRLCRGTLSQKGLQGLCFLTSLLISGCPMFFGFTREWSTYSPFPTSLQRLVIYACRHLRGEGFWELFPQGCLTELEVFGTLKFFTCSDTEPSPQLNQRDLPRYDSRSCSLSTSNIAGVLAQPIRARLSPFLTKLAFSYNDAEHFTKEQEAALKILTLLQEFEISHCPQLQSLPAGLSGLPNLKRFEIGHLDSIHSITNEDGLPSSLTELRIRWCPAIRSIPKGSLPSSLQTLKICCCSGIQSLPEGTIPSSLQNLEITHCESIRSLPKDGLPDSLRLLDVSWSNKELRRQCHKLKGTIPIVKT